MAEFVIMSKEEIEELINAAAERVALRTASTVVREYDKETERKKDRRLHNMTLLLKNYHTLKTGCEEAVYKKTERVNSIMQDIMEMDDSDAVIVSSIKESAERTAVIIDHIETMLDIYREYCYRMSDTWIRRYEVIYSMYISEKPCSATQLAKDFFVSKMTIHNDRKIAIEHLSTLVFGIGGLPLKKE